MNFESSLHRCSCVHSSLSVNRKRTLADGGHERLQRALLTLTNHPALLWKNRRYPFELGSSICCRWVCISSDRQAADFCLACKTWKRAGASYFCLTSLLAPRSPCVLSCSVAKTITFADTGTACFTQREGYYLRNATASPHGPLMSFRHLPCFCGHVGVSTAGRGSPWQDDSTTIAVDLDLSVWLSRPAGVSWKHRVVKIQGGNVMNSTLVATGKLRVPWVPSVGGGAQQEVSKLCLTNKIRPQKSVSLMPEEIVYSLHKIYM